MPCQNGGTCTDGIGMYTCDCEDSYNGTDCENNINECYSNPCQNGGTCMDGINSYTCTCATGFTGTDCQINIDDCDPNPCKNGGTCTDGVGGFTCTCNPVYSGSDCSGKYALFIGGKRDGGLGVLEHPQLSRSRYSNRAVTLTQQ